MCARRRPMKTHATRRRLDNGCEHTRTATACVRAAYDSLRPAAQSRCGGGVRVVRSGTRAREHARCGGAAAAGTTRPDHRWADTVVGEERAVARAPAPPSATPLWGTRTCASRTSSLSRHFPPSDPGRLGRANPHRHPPLDGLLSVRRFPVLK